MKVYQQNIQLRHQSVFFFIKKQKYIQIYQVKSISKLHLLTKLYILNFSTTLSHFAAFILTEMQVHTF